MADEQLQTGEQYGHEGILNRREEPEEDRMKSIKFTGYHAFYKSVAGMISENQGQRPDGNTDLGTMSKVAGTMWKRCSLEVRQEWKRQGQLMREDIDCGLVEHVCAKCSKRFGRAKDLAYHKKQCGNCLCNHCGKQFSCGEALKRHLQSHAPENHCEICDKTFASKQSLERHGSKHTKVKKYMCEKCQSRFTLKSNLRRHEKICQ